MNRKLSLILYTFSHFCVDFACVFFLFRGFSAGRPAETVALGFLLYNVLAFGLQPLIGFAWDTLGGFPAGALGCGLVAAGLLTPFPWAGLALCGVGNAFFHVGGGIDSLTKADGRMTRSGIFVSSGALGVTLGAMAGAASGFPLAVLAVLMALCAGTLALGMGRGRQTVPAEVPPVTRNTLAAGTVLALCLLSVAIRAYGGAALPLFWKQGLLLGLLPGLSACAGKALGGAAADRWGARRVAALSLIPAAALLGLGSGHPLTAAAGIVACNMTMPVTLWAVYSRLPRFPGLAFGLTTLALLAGTVPTFFAALPEMAAPATAAALTLVSAACLITVLIHGKRGVHHEEMAQKAAGDGV